MSKSDVTNVASLDELNDAMKDYGLQSLAVVRDFASQVNTAKESVKQYRGYLENRISRAREGLEYCRYIQSVSKPEFRPSCRWEANWLEKTKADLEHYQNLLAQLDRAYDNFMNRYNSFSNYVDGQLQSSISTLNNEIAELRQYMDNR